MSEVKIKKNVTLPNHIRKPRTSFNRKLLVSRFGYAAIKLWRHEPKHQDSDHYSVHQSSVDETNNEKNTVRVTDDEVEAIMQRLGLFCSTENEGLKETMGSEEISELFNEKEPSLDEVKEAFDVFDENGDGFIDAEELQRVMVMLWLKEGCGLERFKEMIHSFDDNCDGRISFNAFVRFMETSFC